MIDIHRITEAIEPTLKKLEVERLLFRMKSTRFLNISALVFIALLVVGLLAGYFGFPILPIVFVGCVFIIIAGLVYHLTIDKHRGDYALNYKNTVIRHLVKEMDSNLTVDSSLTFNAESGITASLFHSTELFSEKADKYRTEDRIKGTYGKTFLTMAEIHAEKLHSNGKTTYYVDMFKGVLLIADFNKDFKGRTFVFPDIAEGTFGKLGRKFQKLGGRRGTKLVELEDIEFEREFVVYSSNQTEARYILSSSMMRRILALQNRFPGNIRMSFKDSTVCIALPRSSSYLEPAIGTPATDRAQIMRMLKQLALPLNCIEELNLNTRIWTKE